MKDERLIAIILNRLEFYMSLAIMKLIYVITILLSINLH